MSIRKLRAGRVPTVTADQYVGENGSIFWNESTGELRLSNGTTLGGSPIPITLATTGTAGSVKPGNGLKVTVDGTMSIDAVSAFAFAGNKLSLLAATSEMLGGVKLGPGVVTNNEGQIIIDSTGLDFSFGDFAATTPGNGAATLSSIQPNQDIAIVSNGTCVINMVGDFHVHRTADYDVNNPDTDGAVFTIKSDGQIQMKVPLSDSTTGALEIVGNDSGLFMSPNQTGVILHVTGNSGLVSRNYFDANANYVLLAGRRYNGTQLAPRRVSSGDILLRVVAQGAVASTSNADAVFQTFGPARIEFVATEDQTPTAQGGEVRILATANGSAASGSGTLVATFNATTGVTATTFNGPLTGNVTGNVSGTAGSVAAANITGTTLASNVVTSSLTSVGTLGSLSVTGDMTAGTIHGKLYRTVRDAGTIADGGTLTIDFTSDAIVLCNWGNGLNIAYQNYVAGRVVKVMATKTTGTGTDSIGLDGITASHVSSGSTSLSAAADTTVFMEFISTGTTLAGVFLKL